MTASHVGPLALVPARARHLARDWGQLVHEVALAERGGPALKPRLHWKDERMNTTDIYELARHLFTTQGAKAIAEAAQKARACRDGGDEDGAKIWERVEEVLREMRGPRQS